MKPEKLKRLERRAKRRYIQAYVIGALGLIWIVLALTVFQEPLLRGLLTTPEGEDVNLLKFGIFMFTMFGSFFVALMISMYAKFDRYAVEAHYREERKKQEKENVRLFWEAIKVQDWEEAKRLYNAEGLIGGSFRVLCNGIIMGARQVANHTEWKESPDQRMKSYLTEESSQ